jgi:metal-dependent hydrolase (beta-lactamase superfamily II)
MCTALTTLASFLSQVVIPTDQGGIVVTGCNEAGIQLLNNVSSLAKKLETIMSDKVFTT